MRVGVVKAVDYRLPTRPGTYGTKGGLIGSATNADMKAAPWMDAAGFGFLAARRLRASYAVA